MSSFLIVISSSMAVLWCSSIQIQIVRLMTITLNDNRKAFGEMKYSFAWVKIIFIQFWENFCPLSLPKVHINFRIKVFFYNDQCQNLGGFLSQRSSILQKIVKVSRIFSTLPVNFYTKHIISRNWAVKENKL